MAPGRITARSAARRIVAALPGDSRNGWGDEDAVKFLEQYQVDAGTRVRNIARKIARGIDAQVHGLI